MEEKKNRAKRIRVLRKTGVRGKQGKETRSESGKR